MTLLELESLLIDRLKQDFGIVLGDRIYGSEILRQSAVDGDIVDDIRRADMHPQAPVGDIRRLGEFLDATKGATDEQVMVGTDYIPLFMRKSIPFKGVNVTYYVMEEDMPQLTKYDTTEVERALASGNFAEHVSIESHWGECNVFRQNGYGRMTYNADSPALETLLRQFEGLESTVENVYNAVHEVIHMALLTKK